MAVSVSVHGENVEKALRDLKKYLQREQIFRKMKSGRFYEKPSKKRMREKQESERRRRKNMYRKRMEG